MPQQQPSERHKVTGAIAFILLGCVAFGYVIADAAAGVGRVGAGLGLIYGLAILYAWGRKPPEA